ncbi:MAG TPA: phenylacetate--CoA ligase, partial [Vicinamibacteria bacterium]
MSVLLSLPAEEALARDALQVLQGRRLAELLGQLHGRNAFYTRKLDAAGVRLDHLQLPRDLSSLPFTPKGELVADQ